MFNNGLGLSDEAFQELKDELVESGSNPTYREFRNEVRSLSQGEREQFQRAVNARVDGNPGPGSYTHYLRSSIYEAGFSVEETATFKRITSEDQDEQITQINEAFDIDLSELPEMISVGDAVSYEPNYGTLTVIDNET